MKPYYSASGIHLYHGDNASLPEALAAHGLKVADVALLWGDPPYGISEDTSRTKRVGSAKHRAGGVGGDGIYRPLPRDWAPVAGDDKPFDPGPWLTYRRLVLWGANHYADKLPVGHAWWVWDKSDGLRVSDHNSDAELAWTSWGKRTALFNFLWKGLAQADKEGRNGSRLHPTQKPVALAKWGFQRAKLQPGDWVVSPWLGSGPEARAALDMGLNFIGFELVEEYLRACVGRLRQQNLFTLGGTA